MKKITIALICLFSVTFGSCEDSEKIKLKPYSDKILENPKSHSSEYDFTTEYKLTKWYKNQKNLKAYNFSYKSDGHTVGAIFLRPRGMSKPKYPVLLFIRGGYQENFQFSLVHMQWLAEFVKRGFVVICSKIRKNKDGVIYDKFGGEETNDVFNLLRIAKNSPSLKKLDWSRLYSLSWGSRGGIMSYKLLNEELPVQKAVVIEGASDMERLAKERGRGFFYYLSDAEIKNRNVSNYKNITTPLLIIHNGDNLKTSPTHAIKAYMHVREYNSGVKLDLIKNKFKRRINSSSYVEKIVDFLRSR